MSRMGSKSGRVKVSLNRQWVTRENVLKIKIVAWQENLVSNLKKKKF